MVSPSTSRPFPGFDQIFVLMPGRGHPFRGEFDFPAKDSWALTRGESAVPKKPVALRWVMGAKIPGDVLWTTSAHPMIVHTRVIDLFLDHRFTGWGTYAVEVYDKKNELYPDYHGLIFRGRCGPIDHSKSEEVVRQMPGGKFPYLKGLYFDPVSWDGSDLFMPDGKGWMFVTSKVVRVMSKAKVRGVLFEAATDVELSRAMVERHKP